MLQSRGLLKLHHLKAQLREEPFPRAFTWHLAGSGHPLLWARDISSLPRGALLRGLRAWQLGSEKERQRKKERENMNPREKPQSFYNLISEIT